MEIFKTKLSNITKDIFLRNDVKYHNFITSKNNWNIFGNYKKKLIMLGEILEENYQNFIFEDSEIYKGVPTGEDYIDEDGNKILQQTFSTFTGVENDNPDTTLTCNIESITDDVSFVNRFGLWVKISPGKN